MVTLIIGGKNISECTHSLVPPGNTRFIIVRERSAEHEACDAVELVDPLFEVALLTVDLQQSDRKLADVEASFRDPVLGGMTNVLRRRNIIIRGDSLRLCEKATRDASDQHKRQRDARTRGSCSLALETR